MWRWKLCLNNAFLLPKNLRAIFLISIENALRKVSRMNNFKKLFFFFPQGNLENYIYKSPISIQYAHITCKVITTLANERCFSVEIYAAQLWKEFALSFMHCECVFWKGMNDLLPLSPCWRNYFQRITLSCLFFP